MTRLLLRGLREPLVQFLLLGALLVLVYRAMAPGPARRILVDDALVERLSRDYYRRNGRKPAAGELNAIVRAYVQTEAKVREARQLGLHRRDVIVRRRLAQKMDLLAEVAEPLPPPTDDDLAAYLRAHPNRYALQGRTTLRQVFVSSGRHGSQAKAVAARLLKQVRSGLPSEGLGDPFLHGRLLRSQSRRQLEKVFGVAFAQRLEGVRAGRWEGPLPSPYGLHLVLVVSRTPRRLARLAEVRRQLERDWDADRRRRAKKAALRRLVDSYDVRLQTRHPITKVTAP